MGPQVGGVYGYRIDDVRNAAGLEDLYALRYLDLHPLRGDRREQYAIRLSGRVRLVFRVEDDAIVVEEVVDYHG